MSTLQLLVLVIVIGVLDALIISEFSVFCYSLELLGVVLIFKL